MQLINPFSFFFQRKINTEKMVLFGKNFSGEPLGLIAGNSSFPISFIEEAHRNNRPVVAICHKGETLPEVAEVADAAIWVKVGELGKLINTFLEHQVKEVAMAGGINRVKLFGGVKLDKRGAALLMRLRSGKDDVLMRGIAEELSGEGIEVVPCTIYLQDSLVQEKLYTKTAPSEEEKEDIKVGIEAIKAMAGQHIGQLVVVREGVVVAVEAVEGTDAAIRRGGELGGAGTVVVKFAKPDQDMRFDVPTVGLRTIETLKQAKSRVLALEVGRSLIMDEEKVISAANSAGISIVGLGN